MVAVSPDITTARSAAIACVTPSLSDASPWSAVTVMADVATESRPARTHKASRRRADRVSIPLGRGAA